jgi:hypothetical protein
MFLPYVNDAVKLARNCLRRCEDLLAREDETDGRPDKQEGWTLFDPKDVIDNLFEEATQVISLTTSSTQTMQLAGAGLAAQVASPWDVAVVQHPPVDTTEPGPDLDMALTETNKQEQLQHPLAFSAPLRLHICSWDPPGDLHRTAGPTKFEVVGGGQRASSAAALPSGERPPSTRRVQDKTRQDKTRGAIEMRKKTFPQTLTVYHFRPWMVG